jgi:membrane protein DedA with SNARE-associated domain
MTVSLPVPTLLHETPALMLGIVLGALLTEDGATFAAAALAVSGMLDTRLAFLSAFTGLWFGDLGVYFAARFARSAVRKQGWLARWIARNRPASTRPQESHGWALGLSRFFPGTRLPAYIMAGAQRMPAGSFAAITAASAALWVSLIFAFFKAAPSRAMMAQKQFAIVGGITLATFVLFYLWKAWAATNQTRIGIFIEKLRRWEFWPAWMFYAPVAMFCIWFSLRYRGIALPTIANLNQRNGGIVGESKFAILRQLAQTSPGLTAEAYFIQEGSLGERLKRTQEILRELRIEFPFVLKPDTAQRGAGFAKIRSEGQLAGYLQKVSAPLVLQRYVAGPLEAGIFYYRFPNETQGHILGITRKRFPVVVGDGTSTVRELIERDERARLIKKTYLTRLGATADCVLPAQEELRLVEAGNHCQGCIFEDGHDLYTEELRLAFDEICKKLQGFYIGRFDVRYSSDEELKNGKGFTILELNGAASEATNIYDAKNSIFRAYATLYRQWQLVYAIGAANHAAGVRPVSGWDVWRDWKAFAGQACEFPLAD